jgi:hypothetical protein
MGIHVETPPEIAEAQTSCPYLETGWRGERMIAWPTLRKDWGFAPARFGQESISWGYVP